MNCATSGKLTSVLPQVPPDVKYSEQTAELKMFRDSLPIAEKRIEIMNAINREQVVLISGETGCGKTTQVPQFILEQSRQHNQPCRVIAAEPRRIAALSVADRVAQERGEQVGQTVGYQIRLESR